MTPLERFMSRVWVEQDSGCWLWTGGATKFGYGLWKGTTAHRWAYTELVAPIPEGLHIDHLCRVRRCVNPAHLEAVTQAENNRRAAAQITHCPRGHSYTADNLVNITRRGGSERQCKTCARDRMRARAAAAKTPGAMPRETQPSTTQQIGASQ